MADDLLALLPPLSRARDFRLYAGGERRLVDLWQYNGEALLGHKAPAVIRELKNAAERGLLVPLPHGRENRLEKALARFFPGRKIFLFTGEDSLRRALARAGIPGAGDPFPDPALAGFDGKGTVSLWRPFLPEEPAAPFLAPILPWALGPRVLVVRAGEGEALGGDRISPALLAPAARAVYDLALAKDRGEPDFPRIKRALGRGPWRRRGIYLSLAEPLGSDAYEKIFRRFLDAGFLLPPSSGAPLILPGVLSPGEEAKLAGLLGSD